MNDRATKTGTASIAEWEQLQIDQANESGRTPVVLVHGLWLLASSWEPWTARFEGAGYVAVAPGWPDDPATVAEARANPSAFAGKSVGQIADHYNAIIQRLSAKPVVVGHSFGGLLTEILASRGLARAAVAISPAPFRGVLPLPLSAFRVASVVLRNPLNRHRSVPLSPKQFRYGFANAVSEQQAAALYERFSVAGSGVPLFQAAFANLNPWTEAKVNTKNPNRGPLLVVAGERDHTVPVAIAKASYKRQRHNPAPTEFISIPDRGHSLTIDADWETVADVALEFLVKHAPATDQTTSNLA
jgi:pimeloyl-ACP methyl ester carboxylesterase